MPSHGVGNVRRYVNQAFQRGVISDAEWRWNDECNLISSIIYIKLLINDEYLLIYIYKDE
jgi:hypothetical protein